VRKLSCVVGVAGIGLAASIILLARARTSYAADHGDAASLATNKAADITDVYAWMSTDDAQVNLVMDVFPNASPGDHFGTNILYVFHVQAFPAYGMAPTAPPTEVICKFAADTSVQCWFGATEYLAGDPSSTNGITTADGKVKLFAGQRNDPFFFNITGFKNVVAAVEGAAGNLGALADGHGCFDLHAAGPGGTNLGAVLVGFLSHQGNGTQPAKDDFAGQNVQSIVVQVDKSLLTAGGPVIGVWASTNMIGS
jgi:hypothetical protein